MRRRVVSAFGTGFLALACAWGAACLYSNTYVPNAYRSATPIDVKAAAADKKVNALACTYSLLYLVSWGNSGYAAAVKNAMKDDPDGVLYDVKSDIKVTSYLLGLYTRVCTVVYGRAGHV